MNMFGCHFEFISRLEAENAVNAYKLREKIAYNTIVPWSRRNEIFANHLENSAAGEKGAKKVDPMYTIEGKKSLYSIWHNNSMELKAIEQFQNF